MTQEQSNIILRYRLLAQLTLLLAQSTTRQELIDAIHTHVSQLFVAPVTVLASVTDTGDWDCLTREGQQLHHKRLPSAADGLPERVMAGTLRLTNDLATYAAQEGLTLRRLDEESRLPPTASWMGVPLTVQGRFLGILSIQSYVKDAFDAQDLEFLGLFAGHFGLALENAALREQLESEARTDELTGLSNRRQFLRVGQNWVTQGAPWTLAMIDLQGFKHINDRAGHLQGDQVLREVARLLREVVALEGAAFRLGGDEFALLLPGNEQEARAQLQKLRTAVEALPLAIPVRLNVGLATWRVGVSLATVMREADRRMYSAKSARRFL